MQPLAQSFCYRNFLSWNSCFRRGGRKVSESIKFFDACAFWMVAVNAAICDFHAQVCSAKSPKPLAIIETAFLTLKLFEVGASAILQLRYKALLHDMARYKAPILSSFSNDEGQVIKEWMAPFCVSVKDGLRHEWQRRLYHFLDFNFAQVFSYGYVVGDIFIILQTVEGLQNKDDLLVDNKVVAIITLGFIALGLIAQYTFFNFRSIYQAHHEVYSLSHFCSEGESATSVNIKPPSCVHRLSFAVYHSAQLLIFLMVADFYLQQMQLLPPHLKVGVSLALTLTVFALSGLYGSLASFAEVHKWRLKQFFVKHSPVGRTVQTPPVVLSDGQENDNIIARGDDDSLGEPLLSRTSSFLAVAAIYKKLKRIKATQAILNAVNLVFNSIFVAHALGSLALLSFSTDTMSFFAFGVGVPLFLLFQLPQFLGRSWHHQTTLQVQYDLITHLATFEKRDSTSPASSTVTVLEESDPLNRPSA